MMSGPLMFQDEVDGQPAAPGRVQALQEWEAVRGGGITSALNSSMTGGVGFEGFGTMAASEEIPESRTSHCYCRRRPRAPRPHALQEDLRRINVGGVPENAVPVRNPGGLRQMRSHVPNDCHKHSPPTALHHTQQRLKVGHLKSRMGNDGTFTPIPSTDGSASYKVKR